MFFLLASLFLFTFESHAGIISIPNPLKDKLPIIVPDQDEIARIASMLPDSPGLPFGVPCSNRSVWSKSFPLKNLVLKDSIKDAPLSPWSDEAYFEFYKTGSRASEGMVGKRFDKIKALLFAECYFWNGTYLSILEKDIIDVATQKSWNKPSTDSRYKRPSYPNFASYNGTQRFVDMDSNGFSEILAFAITLLGDKLSKTTIDLVKKEILARTVQPVLDFLDGKTTHPEFYWVNAEGNHNSATWAGVLTSAACVLDNKNARARLVGVAYYNLMNAIKVYEDDGYNPDGMMYSSVGLGDVLRNREIILAITNGQLDLITPTAFLVNAMKSYLEIGMYKTSSGIYGASFSDTPDDTPLDVNIYKYIQVLLGAYQLGPNDLIPRTGNSLSSNLISYFNPVKPMDLTGFSIGSPGIKALRKFYELTSVLVTRPDTTGNAVGMAATIKLVGSGLSNRTSHTHNDIGSYVISLNGFRLSGDGKAFIKDCCIKFYSWYFI